ncbi:esterase [Clostridium botulinum]|uniref:esterase n=1 Tax=Clostridium botulinum TaxID=1491 RepID=UPI001E29CED0|nr:esterase [Clostridium botulinum]MCD3223785.1 esterase [Clostridium botulinum C/D]MCD3295315.1 esterase [Clostridium botulinum C/D]
MENLKITSIEDLKIIGQGKIIQLPPFFPDGKPFIAKIKNPNLMNLLSKGKIPNTLIHAVDQVMFGAEDHKDKKVQSKEEQLDQVRQMTELFEIIAQEALLEPTYEDLKNANLELTMQQSLALFQYTQEGVKSLESFRENNESDVSN